MLQEKKIEHLYTTLKELNKRKGELTLLIDNSPSPEAVQEVFRALKDFSENYRTFQPAKKAKCLQTIIQAVVLNYEGIKLYVKGIPKSIPLCVEKS